MLSFCAATMAILLSLQVSEAEAFNHTREAIYATYPLVVEADNTQVTTKGYYSLERLETNDSSTWKDSALTQKATEVVSHIQATLNSKDKTKFTALCDPALPTEKLLVNMIDLFYIGWCDRMVPIDAISLGPLFRIGNVYYPATYITSLNPESKGQIVTFLGLDLVSQTPTLVVQSHFDARFQCFLAPLESLPGKKNTGGIPAPLQVKPKSLFELKLEFFTEQSPVILVLDAYRSKDASMPEICKKAIEFSDNIDKMWRALSTSVAPEKDLAIEMAKFGEKSSKEITARFKKLGKDVFERELSKTNSDVLIDWDPIYVFLREVKSPDGSVFVNNKTLLRNEENFKVVNWNRINGIADIFLTPTFGNALAAAFSR